MRLIDADELKETLKSNCKPELCHDYNTAWCERCCRTNDFEDLIDDAPTVHFVDVFNNNSYLNSYERYREPEPNKYISRIDTECIMLECPGCKSRIIASAFSYAVGTKGYSFCPYCGKDMRKGIENENQG